ncbi:unnamed protein product [Mycena citricolor]|uniref:SNF5-domain-containing protein n=1 Tax=Mycena citricolor TaxID=2018698 RepID=A0AAD2GWU0_9AGAR|nr:unnamed protein product [Mycena citricolor]
MNMTGGGGGPFAGGSGGGINPAMLASYGRQQQQHQQQQQQFGGGASISPAQLMNGGMGMGMGGGGMGMGMGMGNAAGMMGPSQHSMMNMAMNGGGVGGGISPAALPSPMNGGGGGGGGMNPASFNLMGNSGLNPSLAHAPPQMTGPTPNQNPIPPQTLQILANIGVSRDQLAQMNPQERQMTIKNANAIMMRQQQQQQQFASPDMANGFYDGMGMSGMPSPSSMGGGVSMGAGMGGGNMGMGGGMGGGGMGMGGMNMGMGMNMGNPGMGMNSNNPMGMGLAGGGMGVGAHPIGMGSMGMGNGAMGMNMGNGNMGGLGMNTGGGMGMGNMGGGNMGMMSPARPGTAQGMSPRSASSMGMGMGAGSADFSHQNGFQGAKHPHPPPFGGSGFGPGGGTPQDIPAPGSPFSTLKRKLTNEASTAIHPMGMPTRSTSFTETANGLPMNTPLRPPSATSSQPDAPRRASPHRHRSASPVKAGPSSRAEKALPQRVPPLVGPLPASVDLNPATTKVTVVPLSTSLTTIPPLSQSEVQDVKSWKSTDQAYASLLKTMKTRATTEMQEIFGNQKNLPWWTKGSLASNTSRFMRAREPFDVRYPLRKKDGREGARRKGARREGIRLPRRLDPEDADRPELLVPIRLEFDVEHHRMRDTFVWNLNDPVISPELFAQTLVEDYNLTGSYHATIVKSIQDQLSDYRAHSSKFDGDSWDVRGDEEDTLNAGSLQGESSAWWSAWRKRLRSRRIESDLDDDRPMSLEEFAPNYKSAAEDMRIVIKLDILVGTIKLDDQFEWDLTNADASPEQFAAIYTRDLGLNGEFSTAIAHSIREQVQMYQKSLFLEQDDKDDELRSAFLSRLSTAARPVDQVASFTPQLNYLSDGELERHHEKDRDSSNINRRRKKGRKRGANLDPLRTCRTPALGFPELDAATLAAVAAAAAPVSRRAAAAAASRTIANMVASENENGEHVFTPLPALPAPPPLIIKEKTVKGLFKAPAYKSEIILRARAKVRAPIESTAVDPSLLPPPLPDDPPPMAVPMSRQLISNGVWHCLNCGCPESIAVGRRKGPQGDKTLCGTCGKYWHRHRRMREVPYNPDVEHHSKIKHDAEAVKSANASRRGRQQQQQKQQQQMNPLLRDLSPVSDTSSVDDLPQVNGGNNRLVITSSPLTHSSPLPEESTPEKSVPASVETAVADVPEPMVVVEPVPPVVEQVEVVPDSSVATIWPPTWLTKAIAQLQAKWENDRFDVTLRKVNTSSDPEWRIKCMDCPGKLYTPGPGETLSNFEVHLKNRLHRQRVAERIASVNQAVGSV